MKECAFNDGRFCTALKNKRCTSCSFRKTEDELIEGRLKAMERIRNLPNPKRYYILHTYHKQWRGGFEKW